MWDEYAAQKRYRARAKANRTYGNPGAGKEWEMDEANNVVLYDGEPRAVDKPTPGRRRTNWRLRGMLNGPRNTQITDNGAFSMRKFKVGPTNFYELRYHPLVYRPPGPDLLGLGGGTLPGWDRDPDGWVVSNFYNYANGQRLVSRLAETFEALRYDENGYIDPAHDTYEEQVRDRHGGISREDHEANMARLRAEYEVKPLVIEGTGLDT